MESKHITITYDYPEYDKDGEKVIAHRQCRVKYEYDPKFKSLTVSTSNNSVKINGIDHLNFEDIGITIADILPDDINDLGAPIALIEDTILNGFINNTPDADILNNSVFILNYDPEYEMKMQLSSGKIIKFPETGSAFFGLSLKDLL